MAISDKFLPEFVSEMATTRRVLVAAPEAAAKWKPHPKSYSMGDLALHLSNIPHWTSATFDRTELDLAPPDGPPYDPPRFVSMEKALADFDRNVEEGKRALAAASDADWAVPWSLKFGGRTIFTRPRTEVMRSFVMSHMIHHRGQMTVYLRLREVPVPPVYGPTADQDM
jgi:uncharacterized damage-inducible protein DinB